MLFARRGSIPTLDSLLGNYGSRMIAAFLTALLALSPCQASNRISDAQKKDFIQLLKTLPVEGEFYSDAAIDKAGRYLPVLFALTEKDIEKYDIYPFLALSRGLCDRKVHRDYAVRHFAEIRHPMLKFGWGAMLFNAGASSPEIVQFLRSALESEQESKILSEILGPKYNDFRRRVNAYPYAKRRRAASITIHSTRPSPASLSSSSSLGYLACGVLALGGLIRALAALYY